MAALRGITSDHPQRTDTEAIGALLYAALTQRWPYESNAHGLSGLPKGVGLIAPRSGPRRCPPGPLRARHARPRQRRRDRGAAGAALHHAGGAGQGGRRDAAHPAPRSPSTRRRPPFARAPQASRNGRPVQPMPAAPPPPLQSRTGRALKWTVSAILIAALGLGSWQLADTLLKKGEPDTSHSQPSNEDNSKKAESKPIAIAGAEEYAADGQPQHSEQVGQTYDGKPDTAWHTHSFDDGPEIVIKPGVGIVYDLGSSQKVDGATVGLQFGGDHTTMTLYGADSPSAPLSSMKKLAKVKTSATTAKISLKKPAETRYVLLWITAMPHAGREQYSGAGYKQAITEVQFTG
ncbi:hypothetical protein GCM10020000_40290 [Streptomyces olivoverticillatus]